MTDDAPNARAVLSPSDVAARRRPGMVRLGGRVATCSGTTLVVADALRAVTVRLREPADLAPGELVVVRGRLRRGRIEAAHVVTRLPGKPPNAGTEHARFALSGVAARLVARAHALRVVRAWFDRQGFVEVETPLRVPTPGLDAHVHAIGAEGGHLITSPELHMKRLVAGGLPRVYQLARTSRRDEHGALHEPEFTMLEWYRAFSGMNAVIADTEGVVSSVVRALTGKTSVVVGKRRVDVRPPFPRLTVREAFRKHAGVADAVELAERSEDEFFQVFVDRVEPGLSKSRRPVVLTEFPAVQAALARRCPHDPRVAERFEVYVAGIELCNGFGELTDEAEHRARFDLELSRRHKAGEPVYALPERFLAALGEGLPPSGGNALGFDRLVAIALSAESIQDVIAFPETLK